MWVYGWTEVYLRFACGCPVVPRTAVMRCASHVGQRPPAACCVICRCMRCGGLLWLDAMPCHAHADGRLRTCSPHAPLSTAAAPRMYDHLHALFATLPRPCVRACAAVRRRALDLIEVVVRGGIVVPWSAIPSLMALATDPEQAIAGRALAVLRGVVAGNTQYAAGQVPAGQSVRRSDLLWAGLQSREGAGAGQAGASRRAEMVRRKFRPPTVCGAANVMSCVCVPAARRHGRGLCLPSEPAQGDQANRRRGHARWAGALAATPPCAMAMAWPAPSPLRIACAKKVVCVHRGAIPPPPTPIPPPHLTPHTHAHTINLNAHQHAHTRPAACAS